MKTISDKTYIPLWWAALVFGGGAIAFTTQQVNLAQVTSRVEKHDVIMAQTARDMQDIKMSLARLEEQVKFLVDKQRGKTLYGKGF